MAHIVAGQDKGIEHGSEMQIGLINTLPASKKGCSRKGPPVFIDTCKWAKPHEPGKRPGKQHGDDSIPLEADSRR